VLQSFREQRAGLIVAFIIGITSWVLAQSMPRVGEVTIAILLGIFVGNLISDMKPFNPGVLFAERNLLPLATALLGVELQLASLLELGATTIVVILVSVGVSLVVSVQLGKLWGYSRPFQLLMGAGNGICGSSAIAATSSVIHANEQDIGLSISVVNLLGTVGIFLLPSAAQLLSLNETQAGLLMGGTLPAVGQVIAAGFSIGDYAGGVATAVKMGRVLMLGPMVILIDNLMNRTKGSQQRGPIIQVPYFIVGFFALSIFSSLNLVPDLIPIIKTIGKFLLVVAMAGIGMRIHLQTLYRAGPSALGFGALIWGSQIVVILLIITASA
jgi:uncharacterized integral membrane protein (TIGR00698 family)